MRDGADWSSRRTAEVLVRNQRRKGGYHPSHACSRTPPVDRQITDQSSSSKSDLVPATVWAYETKKPKRPKKVNQGWEGEEAYKLKIIHAVGKKGYVVMTDR